MTEPLDRAVAPAHRLSPDRQDEVAPPVLDFIDDRGLDRFTPEDAAGLDEAVAAADRGEFAADEEGRAIWAKHGL